MCATLVQYHFFTLLYGELSIRNPVTISHFIMSEVLEIVWRGKYRSLSRSLLRLLKAERCRSLSRSFWTVEGRTKGFQTPSHYRPIGVKTGGLGTSSSSLTARPWSMRLRRILAPCFLFLPILFSVYLYIHFIRYTKTETIVSRF